MSESIQTKGKTVNDAVSEALLQLGLRRDEVEIKVLEEPKSGLLGFIGSRQAKVLVRKKPERPRGRGRTRNTRNEDDQAHTLGTGTGTGGRSRGGRGRSRTRQDDQGAGGDSGRSASRGRSRGPRRDEDKRPDQAAATGDSRGGRGSGGRGRGRDQQPAEPRGDQGGAQRGEQRAANAEGGAERKSGRSRRGSRGRGRGRGRDRDQQPTAQAAESTNDSRREPRDEQPAANTAPVTKSPRSRRERPAAEIAADTPNVRENAPMTEEKSTPRVEPVPTPVAEKPVETPPPAPAATEAPAAADAPAPVAKPKRKGWGGGLGARVKRPANPAVKERKPVEVIAEAPTSAPRSSGGSSRDTRGSRSYRDDSGPRDRGRSGGYGSADEMVASAVPASKYAQPIGPVTEDGLDGALSELTSGMLARAGFPCEVAVKQGEYRQVRITSDDDSAGMLIGRHGQTVDAVEHLVERMACNAIDDRVRMNLDINEYRLRREESLAEGVDEAVAEVRETGKPYHAEPMSARERRIIHLAVEGIEGVTTYTVVGSGGKHVVISLDDGAHSDDDRNDDQDDEQTED